MLESLKNGLLLIFGNADTGVSDREGDDLVGAQTGSAKFYVRVWKMGSQFHRAGFSKFKRIGEKVFQNLVCSVLIRLQGKGNPEASFHLELDIFLIGNRVELLLEVTHKSVEGHFLDMDVHLPCFHL